MKKCMILARCEDIDATLCLCLLSYNLLLRSKTALYFIYKSNNLYMQSINL